MVTGIVTQLGRRNEKLDRIVLSHLFKNTGPGPIVDIVQSKLTAKYATHIWFIYEWPTCSMLNFPDALSGNYVSIVDPDEQYTVAETNVTRQRVRINPQDLDVVLNSEAKIQPAAYSNIVRNCVYGTNEIAWIFIMEFSTLKMQSIASLLISDCNQ